MHPAARVLHEQVARAKTPGVSYLHFSADAILFRYRDGVSDVARQAGVEPVTTFHGLSVTKTVTAVAVLQLVEGGALALDDPAAAHRPDFPYAGDITVRHLLAHTAGIPNPIPLRWTHREAEHAGFDRDAFFAREFAAHPRVRAAPNECFAYSNLGYQLLGEIIERVTGMSYERYVAEEVLAPVGVSPDELGFSFDAAHHACGYHKRRSVTYPLLGFLLDRRRALAGREGEWQRFHPCYMNGPAYGGLIGTADGFARYLQALLDGSRTLLGPRSQELLFATHRLNDGTPSPVSLSWFRGTLDGHRYFDHAGGGGGFYAEVRLYPALRRGSVLLCNRTGIRNERILDRVDRHLIAAPQPESYLFERQILDERLSSQPSPTHDAHVTRSAPAAGRIDSRRLR